MKIIGTIKTVDGAKFNVVKVLTDRFGGKMYRTDQVYKTRGNYVEYVTIVDYMVAEVNLD